MRSGPWCAALAGCVSGIAATTLRIADGSGWRTPRLLGDASELAAGSSSARLTDRLKQTRFELQPWEPAAVRTIDNRLTSHGAG